MGEISMKGLFSYKRNNEIVYIGIEEDVETLNTHNYHMNPEHKNEMGINYAISLNPTEYKHRMIHTEDRLPKKGVLKDIQKYWVDIYNPKYNQYCYFDNVDVEPFNDIMQGFKWVYNYHDYKNRAYRIVNKDLISLEWEIKNLGLPFEVPVDIVDKVGEVKMLKNSSGYYRVTKVFNNGCKQGFTWVYQYYDDFGNLVRISSVDLGKLEEKVKLRGLVWEKL